MMSFFSTLAGQFAYLFIFAAFLSLEQKTARLLAMAGSGIGILYCSLGDGGPLWVPLVWHCLFFAANLGRLAALQKVDFSKSLGPLESFLIASVFPRFTASDIKELVKVGKEQTVEAGHVVFREGKPTGGFAFLSKGTAGCFCHGIKQYSIEPGRLLGERSFLDETNAAVDLVAVTPINIIFWSDQAIAIWVNKDTRRLQLLQEALGVQEVAKILALKTANRAANAAFAQTPSSKQSAA